MENKRHVRTVTKYTNQELEIAWMGSVIITCFFTSGMIDAVAFNSWNCFVGMQTGMIYLFVFSTIALTTNRKHRLRCSRSRRPTLRRPPTPICEVVHGNRVLLRGHYLLQHTPSITYWCSQSTHFAPKNHLHDIFRCADTAHHGRRVTGHVKHCVESAIHNGTILLRV